MKVIKRGNIGINSPILVAILMWLFLDRLNASGWVYGVIGTLVLVWLCVWIYHLATREEVDVIEKIKNLP